MYVYLLCICVYIYIVIYSYVQSYRSRTNDSACDPEPSSTRRCQVADRSKVDLPMTGLFADQVGRRIDLPYVCIYIYTCTKIRTYIYIYVCVCIYTYIHIVYVIAYTNLLTTAPLQPSVDLLTTINLFGRCESAASLWMMDLLRLW